MALRGEGTDMRTRRQRGLSRCARMGLAIAVLAGLLAGCAPLTGYPKDPEDTDATLTRLAPYFDGAAEAQYLALSDPTLRAQKLNDIILARIHAYDIEFADFERRLYGDGNATTLGGDLVGLVLAGLTATTVPDPATTPWANDSTFVSVWRSSSPSPLP